MQIQLSPFIFAFLLLALSPAQSHVINPKENLRDNSQNLNLKNKIIAHHLAINVDSTGQIDNKGLADFAKKIDGVRILALGEQTHGAGSVFALKTELIKYLHQHHDFDLFILESGMYDVREIYQQAKEGQSIKALAPGNIFYMYANSEEVTPLFEYINAQLKTEKPLTMVGFDSQHTGGLALSNLVSDLTNAQKKIDSVWVSSQQWQEFTAQIQQVLDGATVRFDEEQEAIFFSQLNKLATSFQLHDDGFWLRISKGLIAQAKRQWQIADTRSQEMGENIKWWAEQYPDKKIIVWAHTWHLTKEGNNQINAGKVVSDAFGEEYYMVHFTGEQGQYLSYLDLTNKKVATAKQGSIEQLFSNKSHSAINYVENNQLPLKESTMDVFANDYQNTLPSSQWSTYWDGMFILKEITSAEYKP